MGRCTPWLDARLGVRPFESALMAPWVSGTFQGRHPCCAHLAVPQRQPVGYVFDAAVILALHLEAHFRRRWQGGEDSGCEGT